MAAKQGIWTIDSQGRTTFASPDMAEILGTTAEDMAGRSSFNYVFPEDIETAQRLFQAKENGDIDLFTFRLRRADGSAVWASIHGTAMRGPDGAFSGVVGTFTVIDEP